MALCSLLINATLILEEGGSCAAQSAERYLEFMVPLTLASLGLGAVFGGQSATKLMMSLFPSMFGGELFKSVAASKACQ